ncbi:hypothetical protein DFH06DRAFT_982847 [Mycena polygramma]|nr:hypothetical protein DFH06DRAFT_982847 [Mycena polygramma]
MREPENLFKSFGYPYNIWDESLSNSVARYHPDFDPAKDDDPIAMYGATDGRLDGKTAEESINFRDIIMRWTQPHAQWYWDDLAEGVLWFSRRKFTREDLQAYGEKGDIVYSLNRIHLELMGQLELAMHQILNGLYDFMGKTGNSRFQLDPEWKFLRLMESNPSRSAILSAASSMQLRLERAASRVHICLDAVRRTFGLDGLDTLSSVDSTRSSVRERFGEEEPTYELAKILE